MKVNLAIFSTDVTLEGSIVRAVGAPTSKALIPVLVLALGTKRK